MAQIREQIKIPEKKLSDEKIQNLFDAEFETLVIRMLTEFIELICKMKEETKATQSEIEQNIQGTDGEWKDTGQQLETKGRNKYQTRTELRNKNSKK